VKEIEMTRNPDLKDTSPRFTAKILWTPLALAGWLVSANCGTLATTQVGTSDDDLSTSYAVKSLSQEPAGSKKVSRDPRSYYHYLLALKAESYSRFEDAASHYMEVVQHDPEMEDMNEIRAKLLLRSGQIDKLIEVCEESLERFPDNPVINMILADVLAAKGDHYSAIKYYRKVTEIDPGGSRAYLLQGTVYDSLKQYDQAGEMYRQVVLAEPGNPLGHHFLGQSEIRSGNYEAAQVSLGKAVALRPNFIQAREHFAWVLLKLGKNDEAVRELKLLVKLDPRNQKVRSYLDNLQKLSTEETLKEFAQIPEDLKNPVNIHMSIAGIFYEQAMYLNALDEFQITLIKDDKKETHMLMSRIYEILGRLDKAIEEFEILRKMAPQSVEILRYSARLYSLNGQPNEAVRLVKKAVEIKPENDSLYHSLSLAYMAVEKHDLAIHNMRTAIKLNDSKDSYYFELGALLERSEKYSDAIDNMQRAIELNPMHSNAHNFIGYMYAQEGQYLDKALSHLKKALSIQPRNGYFLDSLGWIYFKKGESEKALTEIKKAMVYVAPDPVLYDHLGDVHYSLKNYEEASGAWKTSLSLTQVKKDDTDSGEMPDTKILTEKINKVNQLLRESY
jgi:tetratricopeptide (TPR) repeat protein